MSGSRLPIPLILDGATGTNLFEAGMPQGACTETWVLEHPQVLIDLQRRYAAAGSQVVMAPTFGGNRINLTRHGVDPEKIADCNRRLLALSREAAAGTGTLVAADLSPLGLFLPPAGETAFEELVELYKEQVSALLDADLFAVETTMTLAEARAAVLAVKELTHKPVYVTFTCDGSGRTLSGTDVLAALTVMEGLGVDAFGLNCSTGPEEMLPQLRRLGERAHVPLIAKPNAGLPQMIDGVAHYNCPPEEFVRWVPDMAAAGVTIFGGCCGTTPEHIAALREAVEGLTLKQPVPREEGLPCASERAARYLDPDVEIGEAISCSEDLMDDIMDAEEESEGAVAIRFQREEDLDLFGENQYALQSVLCVVTDDAGLLEGVLRRYQGRALWGGGDVDAGTLERMREKYGLVIR